jgi:hypothetical protein
MYGVRDVRLDRTLSELWKCYNAECQDDAENRITLRRWLIDDQGSSVIPASSGLTALPAVQRNLSANITALATVTVNLTSASSAPLIPQPPVLEPAIVLSPVQPIVLEPTLALGQVQPQPAEASLEVS